MRGRHHNIFYYYRGPSSSGQGAKEEERYQAQVEDNSTKALVNVLELGGPALTHSFLARFAPPLAEGWPEGCTPTLHLQGGPKPVPETTRLLLGLSLLGTVEGDLIPGDGGSRIDAAIDIPDIGMLAIEVKVVDSLEGPQLARHARQWKTAPPLLLERWSEVWCWAREELLAAGGLQEFLLDQLCEYLEILGFAPWGGFRLEDFAFFGKPTIEQRAIVNSRLAGAWERILEELPQAQRDTLGSIHVGRIGAENLRAWAMTNHGEQGVNLTLELDALELQVNLVGWKKAEAEPLIAWLEDPQGAAKHDLEGFEVVVYAREAMKSKSGKPYWQHETYQVLEKVDGATVKNGSVGGVLEGWRKRLDPKWKLLAIHVRRTYPKAEVLSSGENLLKPLVTDTMRLVSAMTEINAAS